MSEQKHNNGARRRLLKSLVAGGGAVAMGKTLPESWTRPMVEAVVLPAHAQTSPVSFDGLYVAQGSDIGDAGGAGPGSILDMFVAPALAAPLPCNVITQIQIEVRGGNADLCVNTSDGPFSDRTRVDEDSGALSDATPGPGFTKLSGMQIDAGASRLDGQVGDSCGFTALKSAGRLRCTNVTTILNLSSPFPDKA